MNESERIKFALKEWKEKKVEGIKYRALNIELFKKLDHIIDIIGVRRAGKTYLAYQAIKELEKNFGKESVIYVNFENKNLYPLNLKLLDELLNHVFEKNLKKAFLFLDEIHGVKNWERWARSVYDSYKGRIKIIVSGSSSRIIKKEVATLLTGRHISIKVFPLNFREFIEFKGISLSEEDMLYSKEKQAVFKSLFEEYIKFGAFPEVCLTSDKNLKMELLNSYYEDILYKDVVDKYNIKEKSVLENFVKFLFINIGGYFSYKRGKEYLDSLGISSSTRTLLRYTSILEDVFLFFFVPIYTRKMREQAKYPKKTYSVDIGLRNVIYSSEDFGKKAENIVFLELKRKLRNKEINYWKSRNGEEVDFVIREGLKVDELIQVSWDINNKETKERETKAILKAMDEFGLAKGIILTNDFEGEEKIRGKRILYKELWKWLLSLK